MGGKALKPALLPFPRFSAIYPRFGFKVDVFNTIRDTIHSAKFVGGKKNG
jgi:hypothetical protein